MALQLGQVVSTHSCYSPRAEVVRRDNDARKSPTLSFGVA